MPVKAKTKPAPKVTGDFDKGMPGSKTINFATSGGSNCSDLCPHKDGNCYAIRIEIRPDRVQLANKLARHEQMDPSEVLNRAMVELQSARTLPPWVRISSAGSVPNPDHPHIKRFIRTLRVFLTWTNSVGIKVHFPVESVEKAEFYRAKVGDLVVIRTSLTDEVELTTYNGPCSAVVGAEITGKNIRKRRVALARQVAKDRLAVTGRKTVVCPAITSGWQILAHERAKCDAIKCGQCTACANGGIDVLYPLH